MDDISTVSVEDLEEIASVHKAAYSESHFTSRFSTELLKDYYGHFLDKDCLFFKLSRFDESGGRDKCAGFIVLGENLAPKIRQFKKAKVAALFATALANPVPALRKVLQRLCLMLFDSPVPFQESPMVILSIASGQSGKGIGKQLIDKAKVAVRERGYKNLGLYVRVENINAINFYIKCGFCIKGYILGQYYLEADVV